MIYSKNWNYPKTETLKQKTAAILFQNCTVNQYVGVDKARSDKNNMAAIART